MKRFYKTVDIVESDDGFGLTLDGKQVRTPAKRQLRVPVRVLAEAIAEEWRAQGDHIQPETMALTRLANTAIDRVAAQTDAVIAETAKYAETDLLCYRAVEPADLVARQASLWQPLLYWARMRFDAKLDVVSGVVPAEQPAESLRALANALAALDVPALTAASDLTRSCGSVVLALAVVEGRIDADAAVAASLLDETYQTERWGEDEEAAIRRRWVETDIRAAANFVTLLRSARLTER